MSVFELDLTFGHDGEAYFRTPGAVLTPWHHPDGYVPDWRSASDLLKLYPEGSKIHMTYERDGSSPHDWATCEHAWVEVPEQPDKLWIYQATETLAEGHYPEARIAAEKLAHGVIDKHYPGLEFFERGQAWVHDEVWHVWILTAWALVRLPE